MALLALQENLVRRETEALQGTRVCKGLKEMGVCLVYLVPLAHQDHLDCQVQLDRKDRRETWVLLVPGVIQALLAPQDLQDPLQKWFSPCLSGRAGVREEGIQIGQEVQPHQGRRMWIWIWRSSSREISL